MLGSSIPAVLRERASLQPNDVAFTYVDYDHDGAAVPQTLTWAQLNRRAANLASQLSGCGSPGDRAVILAPQGLDYIAAFVASFTKPASSRCRCRSPTRCPRRAGHRGAARHGPRCRPHHLRGDR